MNHPLLNMLGIARRAGKLSVGFDAAAEAVRGGRSRLIVAAADLSAKTEKEIRYLIGRRSLDGDSHKAGGPADNPSAAGKSMAGRPAANQPAANGSIRVIRIPFDMSIMSKAIGTKAGILSVDDDGLAGAVLSRCPVTGEDDAV
ncbi:MAG: hypothetical protein HFE86_09345 [Clostridiales bacterium]|nr:hypothetical protein [Clostridiales bacterium]